MKKLKPAAQPVHPEYPFPDHYRESLKRHGMEETPRIDPELIDRRVNEMRLSHVHAQEAIEELRHKAAVDIMQRDHHIYAKRKESKNAILAAISNRVLSNLDRNGRLILLNTVLLILAILILLLIPIRAHSQTTVVRGAAQGTTPAQAVTATGIDANHTAFDVNILADSVLNRSVNLAQYGGVTVGATNALHVQPGTGAVFHTICDSGCAGGGGSSNITQFGGNNIVTGTGASGLGIPRFTISNDSNILATQSGTWTVSLGAGSAVVGHVIADSGSTTAVTGNVTVVQPTGTNLHTVLDTTSTTAVTQATGSNLHAVTDSGSTTAVTQATGTNLHAVIDSGSTTAVTGNVTVVQPTGTNLHTVLDTTSTTAVTQATGTNLHTVVDSGTTTVTQGTGSNLHAVLDSGTTTVTQGTGTNLHTVVDSGTTTVTQATGTNLHTVCDSGCGGAAADTTASGTLGSLNAAVQVNMAGLSSASVTLPSGNDLVGTLIPESSSDGGTTWQASVIRPATPSGVWAASVAVSSSNLAYNIQVPGGASHVRVRVNPYTSGTATAGLRAVTQPDALPDPLVQGTQAAASATQPNPVVGGGWDGAAVRSFKTDNTGILQANITGIGGTVTLGNLPQQPFLNVTDFNDVAAGTPARGDIITVPSSGKWTRFALGATNTIYQSNGTDLVASTTIGPCKIDNTYYVFTGCFAGADIFAQANTAAFQINGGIQGPNSGTVIIPPGNYTNVATQLDGVDNVTFLAYGATVTMAASYTGKAVYIRNAGHGGIKGLKLIGPAAGLATPGTPALSTSTSGGSLGAATSIFVRYTFVSSVRGESIASAEANVTTGAGSTNSVTVTAPSLPTGASGYTVYSSVTANTEKQQTVSNACVNITANCVIQVIGAGSAFPAVNSSAGPSIGMQLGCDSSCLGEVTAYNTIEDIQSSAFGRGFVLDGSTSSNGTYGNTVKALNTFSNGVGFWAKPTSANDANFNVFIELDSLANLSDGYYIDGANGNMYFGIRAESNAGFGVNFPGSRATNAGQLFGMWGEANTLGDIFFGSAANVTQTSIIGANLISTPAISGSPGGAGNQLITNSRLDIYSNATQLAMHINSGVGAGVGPVWVNDEGAPSFANVLALSRTGAGSGNGAGSLLMCTIEYPCLTRGQFTKDGQADTVSTSGAINTGETVIIKTPALPANRVVAGTHFRITLDGTCTSTVANTSTFTVRWGTLGTTGDGTVAAFTTSTAATSGTNNGFRTVIDLTVRTAGASATSQGMMQVTSDGNIGIVATPNVKSVAGTAFNTTTGSAILSVAYKSAATTTTSTFTNAYIEVVEN